MFLPSRSHFFSPSPGLWRGSAGLLLLAPGGLQRERQQCRAADTCGVDANTWECEMGTKKVSLHV